jgi:hypothetical protein
VMSPERRSETRADAGGSQLQAPVRLCRDVIIPFE